MTLNNIILNNYYYIITNLYCKTREDSGCCQKNQTKRSVRLRCDHTEFRLVEEIGGNKRKKEDRMKEQVGTKAVQPALREVETLAEVIIVIPMCLSITYNFTFAENFEGSDAGQFQLRINIPN